MRPRLVLEAAGFETSGEKRQGKKKEEHEDCAYRSKSLLDFLLINARIIQLVTVLGLKCKVGPLDFAILLLLLEKREPQIKFTVCLLSP